MLNSKRNLSAAEVKLATWILQTRVKNLYGTKVTVQNIKKLSSTEIRELQSLLNSISFRDENAKTFTAFRYDRVGQKVYKVVTSFKNNKEEKLSETPLPLTDFVTEK